jgi:preprotein translocase, YajC subunit
MNLSAIILQAAPSTGQGTMQILMIVVMIVIFYFFMIRPQQKKQKEIQKARAALKVGDNVVTSGGLYGKIREIGDVYMILEISDGVRVKIDKTSVFASFEDTKK